MFKFIKSGPLALSAVALTALAVAGPLAGQGGDVVAQEAEVELAPLYFTNGQATGGAANYNRSCASCHGTELEGFSAPALSGANFSWLNRPVTEMHTYIQDLMPVDAPGTLSDAQVSTIIAYIARSNGMQPGDQAMPTDPAELEGIGFLQ